MRIAVSHCVLMPCIVGRAQKEVPRAVVNGDRGVFLMVNHERKKINIYNFSLEKNENKMKIKPGKINNVQDFTWIKYWNLWPKPLGQLAKENSLTRSA